MQLALNIKSVYGKELIYPVCNGAKALARIAGTKTLSRNNIEDAKALGHTFVVVPTAVKEI